MEYKISVIIPIFNSEKYLKESIESVINQTIGFENIQLILINDGSTDNSKEIINSYSEEYSNIQAYHLEESHRIGGIARNEGLKYAEGEYLMFLDSDDKFDEITCEKMYKAIKENNADIVTGNYKCMYENGKIWPNPIFDESCKTKELEEVNEEFFYLYCPSVCLKIFKTELIKQNDIKFLGKVPAEDAYFSSFAFLKSQKIYYISDVIYYYRRRNRESFSTSWMRDKSYFDGINFAFRKIYELFKQEGKLAEYKYFYAKNLLSVIYKIADTKLLTEQERAELIIEFQWFFKLSKDLNVVFEQRATQILLEKFRERDIKQAITLCEVIRELRFFMNEIEKEMMTKPRKILL